jgi:hypothetical protein
VHRVCVTKKRKKHASFDVFGLLLDAPSIWCTRKAYTIRTCYCTYHTQKWLPKRLLQCRLQALEDLLLSALAVKWGRSSYLKFNLGFSNVSLAAAAAGDLLGFCDLVPDGLLQVSRAFLIRHVCPTSALKSSSGYPSTALMLRTEPGCTTAKPPDRKNCLLPPCSSMISTRPGFSCSIEGTWFAKTPISPVSAGRLTWTLHGLLSVCARWGCGGRRLAVDVHILRLVDRLRKLVSLSCPELWFHPSSQCGGCVPGAAEPARS